MKILKIKKYFAVLNILKLRQGCKGFSSFLSPVSLAIKKAEARAEPAAARLGAQIKINIPIILMLVFYFNFNFKCMAQMPESDIWLFKIKQNKQNQLMISDSINLTKRKGYDNQPSFSKDEKKIYYVSVREDHQADIYTYELKSKKITQLTNTRESEYSPQLNPEGKSISVVVVEQDSSQKIHVMDALTGSYFKKYDFDSVGYYQYLNTDTLIYYKLTEPHSLRMRVIKTGEDKWICNHPIRGFKTINRCQLLYGVKDSLKVTFYIYDFSLNKAQEYAIYKSTNEDAIWHPELGLMKSEGNKLLRFNLNKKDWEVYLDLGSFKIKKITRFIFDSKNKYLVVVNNT